MKAEELNEWMEAVNDKDIIGLWRDESGQLMFDRRYRVTSAMYELIGPRSIDMNINGSDSIPVPAEVERALL